MNIQAGNLPYFCFDHEIDTNASLGVNLDLEHSKSLGLNIEKFFCFLTL